MPKEKRAVSDLDAELAALEAELAALEGKPKKAKAKAPPPSDPARDDSPRAPLSPAEAPPPAERKSRFSLPKLPTRRKDAAADPTDAPGAGAPSAPAAAVEPAAPEPAAPEERHARGSDPLPTFDPTPWRQEGDAWVRTVPGTPVPAVRRVLDENGALVREEPATSRDLDEARGVKAERGIGKLLRRK